MNKTQKRVLKVLERITAQVTKDANYADGYSETLNDLLEGLAAEDFFGTEQSHDPRGDYRNGQWHRGRVEGVDQ